MSESHTIDDISTALDKLIAEDYTFFLSFWNKRYNISISKKTYGENPIDLTVKGEGETVALAVERAMNNFPKNPLDGARWASQRLAAPVAEEGEFTET